VDFLSLPLLGAPLDHYETYVYYDGPKFFSMKSATWDIYYLANAVDENENTGEVSYLLLALTSKQFQATRSGLVPLRDAFATAPAGSLSLVNWNYDDEDRVHGSVHTYEASNLPDAWLPREGVTLDLPTPTADAFEAAEIIQLADAQRRTVFAVKVETPNALVTQFPARNAGLLQTAIAGEFEALAREKTDEKSLAREIYPVVLGLRAASFVVVLGVESPDALIEPVEVTASVFHDLQRLLAAAADENPEVLLSAMRQHGAKVRNRLRDILEPLADAKSGVTFFSSVAYSSALSQVSVAGDDVTRALEAIDKVVPDLAWFDIGRGVLIGKNVRLLRFEIFDSATARKYSGYMTEQARDQASDIAVNENSLVKATIRRETPFADQEDSVGIRYVLESITGLGEQATAEDLPPR